jgi:hypothetical protein
MGTTGHRTKTRKGGNDPGFRAAHLPHTHTPLCWSFPPFRSCESNMPQHEKQQET